LFPHHPINIPQIGAQRKIIRPVKQVSSKHKKEGEPFGFSLLIVFMVLD
jgi:hypothetical protein